MFRALGSFFLVSLIAAGGMTAAAAPGSQFRVARADIQPILAQATRLGPLFWVEGEIREAGPNWFAVSNDRGRHCLRMAGTCPIFVNGRLSCLAAIRPVASNAYVWARIWCDRNGVPAVIEAAYCGGELLVLAVTAAEITGLSTETGKMVSLAVRGDYPPELPAPGRLVYVLLDLDGQIRRVSVL